MNVLACLTDSLKFKVLVNLTSWVICLQKWEGYCRLPKNGCKHKRTLTQYQLQQTFKTIQFISKTLCYLFLNDSILMID